MDEETPISRHHPATLFSRVSPHDGLRVGLRLARPTDQARVRAFLERLSPETRRRRFGTPLPQGSETLVRHFTLPDPRRRLIVLATAPGDGGEQVAGIVDAVFEGGDTGESRSWSPTSSRAAGSAVCWRSRPAGWPPGAERVGSRPTSPAAAMPRRRS
jgi:hypothetical protein